VASGAKPGPSALRYNASSFDLCARTDRRPLADLALTVEQTNDRPTLTPDPGAACLFEMRTPDGYMANLLVRAATPASIEEAEGLFRSTRRVTAMDFAGAVTGLGDEAEAYSKESEPGFKYSEYKVSVRSGNLVLDVWLAVGGVAFTPVATLAERSQAIARTVLTQIPRV